MHRGLAYCCGFVCHYRLGAMKDRLVIYGFVDV